MDFNLKSWKLIKLGSQGVVTPKSVTLNYAQLQAVFHGPRRAGNNYQMRGTGAIHLRNPQVCNVCYTHLTPCVVCKDTQEYWLTREKRIFEICQVMNFFTPTFFAPMCHDFDHLLQVPEQEQPTKFVLAQ